MAPYDPETTRWLCDLVLAEARQVSLATVARMEALRNRFREQLQECAVPDVTEFSENEGFPQDWNVAVK